jgi:hypothetical protein
MYEANFLDFRHRVADSPPALPIDILYALPDYVTNSEYPGWIFNLPGSINDLMGSVGWERATQVLKPRIWAPGWTDEQLMNFAAAPFGRNKYEFPRIEPSELRAITWQYEIHHFVGNVLINEDGPSLDTGATAPLRNPRYGEIRDELLNSGARLLILQNPGFGFQLAPIEYLGMAAEFAQALIADGGPPVLVIGGTRTPEASNKYLTDVYANIVHDYPLSSAARPQNDIDSDVIAQLFLGQGGENILRLSVLRDQLNRRVAASREEVASLSRGTESEILNSMSRYLDQRTMATYQSRFEDITSRMQQQVSNIRGSMQVAERQLDFSRESGGAVPLAEGTAAMSTVEEQMVQLEKTALSMDDFVADITVEAQTAPRVLNAGFSDVSKGTVLGPREALISGREYEFLIDIGPKWNNVPSLVVGNQAFPEFALPPEEAGYPIHVVFISSELEQQQFFSAWIYVPRNSGRSFPYDPAKEQKAEKSGPIAFRFKAPTLNETKTSELHGRLCLYYRNNLLQSARVQATVANTAEFTPEVDNVVDVDYVISGKIQNLDEYATRKLRFTPEQTPSDHPVSVNLTLNDDGKHHRVLVRHLDELPTAPPTGNSPIGWTPFDPLAARWALENARDKLKSCFFLRDEKTGQVLLDGKGEPSIGLSQNNAKTKPQFLWDLLILAKFGRELFDRVFGDVRPEGNWPTKADWTRSLRKTLQISSIIQVARTGPANYIFPWALVYQYPLPGPDKDIKFCRITDEWDQSGRRTAKLMQYCEHRNEAWHQTNIICPYGFWGLNHIIEQPIPALERLPDGTYILRDATDKIVMGPANLDLSIGVTHDVSPADVTNHLTRLRGINPLRLQPANPADDRDKVRGMLKEAMVVYFLCHGEYDIGRSLPYLSIGLRDTQEIHRIYPDTLQAWADAADLKAWGTQRPLIFINGCHTTNLTPGEVLNFVTALGYAGAGGVIGTEISVLANVAIEVAESLFQKIAGNMPVPVGEAMYQTRWELANKGNLLGLAYSLFCLANLHISKN